MRPAAAIPAKGRTPLERMTDLTRRIVAVRKEELPKPRTKKRKRR